MSNDRNLQDAVEHFSRAAHALIAEMQLLGAQLGALAEVFRATIPPEPVKPSLAAPDPTEWHQWSGGFQPCDDDEEVWVQLRDGRQIKARGIDVQWRRYKDANYVAAWQRAKG